MPYMPRCADEVFSPGVDISFGSDELRGGGAREKSRTVVVDWEVDKSGFHHVSAKIFIVAYCIDVEIVNVVSFS